LKDARLYNSRIVQTYLEYLRVNHPQVDMDWIFRMSGITPLEVEDAGHWFTQAEVDRFYDAVLEETGNPSIAREAGRYIASNKASGILRRYIIGFLTPGIAYRMMEKVAATLSRAYLVKSESRDSRSVRITFSPKKDVHEKPYQCENRIGLLESMARVFTNQLASIDHPFCIHRGDGFCEYNVSWETSPSVAWKLTGRYAAFIAIVLSAGLFFRLSFDLWSVITLSSGILILGVFNHAIQMEKEEHAKKLRNQGDEAKQLIHRINRHYNEALLVQEIGQAASSILDFDQLLRFMMETLRKRLDYDRGLVMLADENRGRLVYTIGYGYGTGQEDLLKRTVFYLDRADSKGQFVRAFREQKPFLVNDFSEVEIYLSDRSVEFGKILNVKSFLCIPIVFEGRSEGILAVDSPRSGRSLDQSDISLLMGIAPQIGISINNARIYRMIQEREERFRTLSENAPDIIFTLDLNGVFEYVNPAWERILGHGSSEVIGKPLTAFARNEDVAAYESLVRKGLNRGGTFQNHRGVLIHREGEPKLFSMNAAPNLDSETNVIGLVGVLKDVTEQNRLENQLLQAQKMEAVGTLAGGIAHDFNNILQAINGYNQLLIMKDRDGQRAKYLSSIGDLIQRGSNLIQKLMVFSRQYGSSLSPVNINHEIIKMNEIFLNTIPKMIRFELDLDENLPEINADEGQIGQIIMNLVINARDVMPEGGNIKIETRKVPSRLLNGVIGNEGIAGDFVLLSVSDNGMGMDDETKKRIFEPFFTTKAPGKGTGLGLSVVYGIVQNHGGFILCDSQPGKGTTFNIFFPALETKSPEAPPRFLRREENEFNGSETILIVDDETNLLETSEEILRRKGYGTLTAKSGEEAIRVYGENRDAIDLVMLDLIMPGMGGIKCMEELTRIEPSVRILITSGFGSVAFMKGISENGRIRFMKKPYLFEDLLHEIRGFFDSRESR